MAHASGRPAARLRVGAVGAADPTVYAWADRSASKMDRVRHGDDGELEFLEHVLHELLLSFTWWVNREDADGTSWRATHALNLLGVSLEFAHHRPACEDIASTFFERLLGIAGAICRFGVHGIDLWCDEDGFFCDVLHCGGADASRVETIPLEARSLLGRVPLVAVGRLDEGRMQRLPSCRARERGSARLDGVPHAVTAAAESASGGGARPLLSDDGGAIEGAGAFQRSATVNAALANRFHARHGARADRFGAEHVTCARLRRSRHAPRPLPRRRRDPRVQCRRRSFRRRRPPSAEADLRRLAPRQCLRRRAPPCGGRRLRAFAQAHDRVYGDAYRARSFLEPLRDRLMAHGVGAIAESFDGARDTHRGAARRRRPRDGPRQGPRT